MDRFRIAFRLVCCIYICAFVCLVSIFGQNPAAFEASDCAVPIPKGERVECGYLAVAEDRALKNSRTIRLPVIILKSESPNPRPDPILRTLGGPGASSLRMVTGRRFSPWLRNRDVIIFEQRGTKYARPALECPEVSEANINSAKKQLGARPARLNELKAAAACHDRLVKQGVDPSAYNSAQSAADIEDLRRVLKLDKINLWGISYSARLMLNVMRDYPDGIRSVVLESPLPPEVNYDEVGVDGVVYALNQLFKNCRSDADCRQAYPDLENEFYEVVRRLNREPVRAAVVGTADEKTGQTNEIKLDGNDFATWIVDYLLSNEASAIADAPMVIHRAFLNRYEPFRRYAADKISPSSYALGMRYSVWCGEEFPFENMRKIRAQSFLYPKLKGYEVMALPDICGVWKVRRADPVENKPVKSDIPALVLTAEYDAYTPPAWGRSAAKNLKNSFLFEVPWAGHGPAFSTPCARQMVAEFFDNPQSPPKSECLAKVREQFKFAVKRPE